MVVGPSPRLADARETGSGLPASLVQRRDGAGSGGGGIKTNRNQPALPVSYDTQYEIDDLRIDI